MKHPNSVDPAIEEQTPAGEDTSFGDILSQFEQEQHEHEAPGQPLEGTVIAVRDTGVFVDIGRKTEGVIPVESLRNPAGQVDIQPGDKVLVNVQGRNEEGYYQRHAEQTP